MLTILYLSALFTIVLAAMDALKGIVPEFFIYVFGGWLTFYLLWAHVRWEQGRKTYLSQILSFVFRPITRPIKKWYVKRLTRYKIERGIVLDHPRTRKAAESK